MLHKSCITFFFHKRAARACCIRNRPMYELKCKMKPWTNICDDGNMNEWQHMLEHFWNRCYEVFALWQQMVVSVPVLCMLTITAAQNYYYTITTKLSTTYKHIYQNKHHPKKLLLTSCYISRENAQTQSSIACTTVLYSIVAYLGLGFMHSFSSSAVASLCVSLAVI